LAVTTLTLTDLWAEAGFKPNDAQREAILHTEGPLYLPAGPGSGKTRVLLWRTLNLLAFHDVKPDEIFLSTFTEKAALQLREGLQALLGAVTNRTGRPFDLSQMYVGTVHSLCQRLLTDRRFSSGRQRPRPPHLLDELGQYFYLSRNRNWRALLQAAGLDADDKANEAVCSCFGHGYPSKHEAIAHCIAFFNRLSEECVEPSQALQRLQERDRRLTEYLKEHDLQPESLELLIRLYAAYRERLASAGRVRSTDLSLIQQEAYNAISAVPAAGSVFKHVIIDEYQDTNTIQERLFFKLAQGHKNLCVVGDDDQALYRFRGATVENFVQFPERCERYLGCRPLRIPLSVNYRSRKPIVTYYSRFMGQCNWQRVDGCGHYRVVDKGIVAQRDDHGTAVVRTSPDRPADCFAEIAGLVCDLLQHGAVEDANQIAFLFPSLKSVQVTRMREALESRGLKVHAPRAGRFLEVTEATEMFGVLGIIFGTSPLGGYQLEGWGSWNQFRTWLHNAKGRAAALAEQDPVLAHYIEDRKEDLARARSDFAVLLQAIQRHGWDLDSPYELDTMRRPLVDAEGLSRRARGDILNSRFERVVASQAAAGRPVLLRQVLQRATSLDWTLLDAFYQICGMAHFRAMFDLAEQGKDEGPICNLALISQYLRRFMDEYSTVITAELLADGLLSRLLFGSYLYALWRLGETEYEDREHPFPKGRIPFLTIHQAKGLEFPVVVLANPAKQNNGPQLIERMVRPFLTRDEGEPLDRMAEFDIMRMFYVALSRAKNLLVVADLRGPGVRVNEPFRALMDELPTIEDLDLATIPAETAHDDDLPKSYSYTGDFLAYKRCPRQYMIFRKYGFEASHTQTEFFGSLVHRTLDDLHNYLIARKAGIL